MSDDYRDCKLLLAKAAGLYEKHEAGRPEPFNVFSVLRKETDEVNLHSRFLHTLLEYQKPRDGAKENLEDFLQHVAEKNFALSGVKVERERDYIDILITNATGQAVVIENKIWADDRPKQLQRYHETLKDQGYSDIHLLYLTLHGHDPSGDSAGTLDYKPISYKDDLHPWLERCQQRAYDGTRVAGVGRAIPTARSEAHGHGLHGSIYGSLEEALFRGQQPRSRP